MDRRLVNRALAGSFAAALASLAAVSLAQAEDQAQEQCYGVALKGQNDCKASAHDCKGHSTVDYDGQSFKLVAKGTCASMTTPHGPGSLTPIERPA
jgi:uncharacterized membrane protein